MSKYTIIIVLFSLLINLFLYHLYDSKSSELSSAKEEISRLETQSASLQDQVEKAYLLREIDSKTVVELEDEQSTLQEKKDVLVAKITTQQCFQSVEHKAKQKEIVNVHEESVSADDVLPDDLVRVLNEAADDLQR